MAIEYGWGEYAKYGARGLRGGDAIAAQLEELVRAGGIASPVETRRGLAARLRYLSSPAGRAVLAEAGVQARPAVMRAWAAGTRTPRAATAARIDRAYLEHRRANVIRSGALTRHLERGGRGTRMEIHPVDQSAVDRPRWRDLDERSVQLRGIWADVVGAWAAGDASALDDVWWDIIYSIDSPSGAYEYVSSVGFA